MVMDPPYDKASRVEMIWQLETKVTIMASIRLSTLFSVRIPHAKRVRTDRF